MTLKEEHLALPEHELACKATHVSFLLIQEEITLLHMLRRVLHNLNSPISSAKKAR
jgi:hypothetical protein